MEFPKDFHLDVGPWRSWPHEGLQQWWQCRARLTTGETGWTVPYHLDVAV